MYWNEGRGAETFVLIGKRYEFDKEMKMKNEHPQQRLINTSLAVDAPKKESFATHQ